ncbi:holo-[acyl-carrier protein] synthase [Chitinophaga sp. W3I9]|uniref:holo-ACP synthase n=1 Tax=Chitinophaga sp. W3I9 TaxID=3373924 RepID=UPI003D19C035
MIVGIGTDIVDHKLTSLFGWEKNVSIQKRIFTNLELEIFDYSNNLSFLSGRFAAKEAVLKCLGTGMQDGIALTDIEILRNQENIPVVYLSGQVKVISDSIGIIKWHLSISHSSSQSIAFAIAET